MAALLTPVRPSWKVPFYYINGALVRLKCIWTNGRTDLEDFRREYKVILYCKQVIFSTSISTNLWFRFLSLNFLHNPEKERLKACKIWIIKATSMFVLNNKHCHLGFWVFSPVSEFLQKISLNIILIFYWLNYIWLDFFSL